MIKISEMPTVGPNNGSEFGHIIQDGINKKGKVLFEDSEGVLNSDIQIIQREVLNSESFIQQEPPSLDTPLQLTFGAAQGSVNDPVMIDSLGNITINETATYAIDLGFQFGRTGNPGAAIIYAGAKVDGVFIGNSIFAELDDSYDIIPGRFSSNFYLEAGRVITVELFRDGAGANYGGVFPFVPNIAGPNPAPSCFVRMGVYTSNISDVFSLLRI